MLFHPINLPYWIILGMGVCCFLLVIFSGGGDHDTDLDVDADVDVNLDADHPLDFDVDAGEGLSASQVMGWLGFGRAPLILLVATDLSFLGIFGWFLTTTVAELVGQPPGAFWSGAIFSVSLVLSLVAGGFIARPIGKALAAFGEDASSDRLIGCVGTVSSAVIPPMQEGRIGQVNVIDPARNLVNAHAVLPEWATVIPRVGTKVLVIDRLNQTYLVIAKDSPDEEHWLENSPSKQDSR